MGLRYTALRAGEAPLLTKSRNKTLFLYTVKFKVPQDPCSHYVCIYLKSMNELRRLRPTTNEIFMRKRFSKVICISNYTLLFSSLFPVRWNVASHYGYIHSLNRVHCCSMVSRFGIEKPVILCPSFLRWYRISVIDSRGTQSWCAILSHDRRGSQNSFSKKKKMNWTLQSLDFTFLLS